MQVFCVNLLTRFGQSKQIRPRRQCAFHILRYFPKRNNHIFSPTGKAMVAERENAFLEVFDLSKKAMV